MTTPATNRTNPRPGVALYEGFAVCMANNRLLPASFRPTAVEAIHALFADSPDEWANRQKDGWSVEFVYVRMFTPRFYVDVVPEEKGAA